MTTALQYVRSLGIEIGLDHDGYLTLDDMQGVQSDTWDLVLDLAKDFKADIVRDLQHESQFKFLLQKVGAKVVYEDDIPVLRFDPPLAREQVNPDRWGNALILEELFWSIRDFKFLSPDMTISKKRSKEHKHLTPQLLNARKVALPWIRSHLDELLENGWTRAGLFKAGRFKYPFSRWGVCFFSIWLKPNVQVKINRDKSIAWHWYGPNDELIIQSCPPQ